MWQLTVADQTPASFRSTGANEKPELSRQIPFPSTCEVCTFFLTFLTPSLLSKPSTITGLLHMKSLNRNKYFLLTRSDEDRLREHLGTRAFTLFSCLRSLFFWIFPRSNPRIALFASQEQSTTSTLTEDSMGRHPVESGRNVGSVRGTVA